MVRTELGGPQTSLSIEESIPNVVNTIDAQHGKPGLHYLDYLGRTVPWVSAENVPVECRGNKGATQKTCSAGWLIYRSGLC